jgi:hypothetical protein
VLEDYFSYVFVILNSIMKVVLYAISPKEVFFNAFSSKEVENSFSDRSCLHG